MPEWLEAVLFLLALGLAAWWAIWTDMQTYKEP